MNIVEINPGLIAVQFITFSVAIFLLWKLFWKDLVLLIENRRKSIADDIEKAKNDRLEAEELNAALKESLDNLDDHLRSVLLSVSDESERMKTSIIEKAHEEAKLIIQNAREEIESEKEMIMTDIREKTVELSIKLAERILEDNIDESKNDKMARDFLKGLE